MGRSNFATKVLVLTLTMLMVFNIAMPYNYSFAIEEAVNNQEGFEDADASEDAEDAVLEGQEETEETGKLDEEEAGDSDIAAEKVGDEGDYEEDQANEELSFEEEKVEDEQIDEKIDTDSEVDDVEIAQEPEEEKESDKTEEVVEKDAEEKTEETSEEDTEEDTQEDATVENEEDENANQEETQAEESKEAEEQESIENSIMRVITPGEDTYLATYEFIVDGVNVNTQIVKNGDSLLQPTTPSKEGYRFIAWSYGSGAEFTDFGEQSSIEADQTVRIFAKFEKVYYVTFEDETGKVIATKESDENDKVLADVTFSLSSTKLLVAWRSNDGREFSIGSELVVTENMILKPVIKEGHSIVFETGENATIIRPQFVAANATSIAPVNPSRLGYEFDGWLRGGSLYTFGNEVSEDITLVASWTPIEVKYTVIHWQEKANGEGYAVYESEYKFGETEDTTTSSPKSYDGFTVQNINEQSIKGDGSTIVNVYYDRNIYQVNFYTYQDEYVWKWHTAFRNRKDKNIGNTRYGKWKLVEKLNINENLTITAKYESNISNLWPSNVDSQYSSKWKAESGKYQQGIDIMPLGGANFYEVRDGSYYTVQSNYYLESQEANKYVLRHSDIFESDSNKWYVTEEDRYPITGFTLNTSKSNSVDDSFNWSCEDSAYTADFYYTRNTYSIEFFNNDKIENTVNRKYESNISDVAYTPEKPSGKEEYEFAGWYNNEACIGQPVDFNETMPAHNIIAYAKWVLPNINLTAYDNMSGTNNENTHKASLEYKGLIDESTLPTPNVPEGYEFVYWAEKDASGRYVKYNFNTILTEDIVLYPYMRDSSEFTVSYNVNEGNGNAPTDTSKYKMDSSAILKSAASIIPPANEVFLYWTTDAAGNSDRYYPYGTIVITGNMTLYAQYGPVQGLVDLTYHTNYPLGMVNETSQIIGSANNTRLRVKSLAELEFDIPSNYIFIGWKDGQGRTYQSGDEIIIDNSSSNVLSAQWQEVLEITVEANSDSKVYNANEQVVSGLKNNLFEINGKNYTVSGLTAEAKGLDVGTYPVLVTGTPIVTDENGRDVTSQFTVSTKNGSLEIKPAKVTVTAQNASKEYGQEDPMFTAQVDGLVGTDEIVYTISRPATDEAVGTYFGAIIASGATEQGNYLVEYAAADFEIRKIQETLTVNIKGQSKTVKYNGNEQEVMGYTDNAPADVDVTLSSNLHAIASGTDAGTYNMGLSANDFIVSSDIYANIEINIIDGILNIEKRDLVFTSATASKEYDGTPLTNLEVTVTGDGFVNDEGVYFEVTGSQTLVGNSDNVYTYTLIDGAKEENYNITVNMGTLNVVNRDAKYEITVTANSHTSIYDGTEQAVNGIISSEFSVAGNTYNVSGLIAEAKGTDAGIYKANVIGTPIVTDASGHDVTEQFIVKTESGSLTINKRNITFTSATASKEYDGTNLVDAKVTVTGDGFAANENVEFNTTGSQLLVGSSDNDFTYTLINGAKAENYNVSLIVGTLTVTSREAKYEISVEANSGEYIYDATEKSVTGINKTVYLIDGKEYTVSGLTAEAKATDAGTYNVNIVGSATVVDAEGHNVTSEFAVKPVSGKLVINKRNVTFTSATASKEYDGTVLTNEEVVVTGDGFVNDEGVDFEVTGSQTLVGNSENTYTYSLIGGAKAENYNITAAKGILTVTSREAKYDITIEANSGEFKYDGTEKVVNGLKESTFTVDGKEYTISGLTVEAKASNAGEYQVNIVGTAVVLDAEENDVTSEFAITPVSGTLIINQRDLTFTSDSSSRIYNGYPLTNETILVTGDGFVEGEGVEFIVTGSQTSVGSSDNTFEYEFSEATLEGNYNITKVLGSLTVNRRYVPVEPPVTPVDPPVTPDEPEEVIEEEETPGGEIPEEETFEEEEIPGGELVEEKEEEIIEEPIEEEELPAGELPNTGGIPMSILYLLGGSSIVSGLFLKKKKEDEEK